jgi:hypothetical protein
VTLAAEDRAQLATWVDAVRADPGGVPAGVEIVQQRWIRAVGRAALPRLGPVFLKWMGFPRPKDRLRYLLRRLPAQHEARLLDWLAARGLRVPAVVLAAGARRLGLPRWSLLVTRALPGAAPAAPGELLPVAARLAELGLWHPDLHPGNFVRCADGQVAVLDLQSARRCRAPLRGSRRARMAAKLLLGLPDPTDPAPLVAVGLIPPAAAARVAARAARMHRQWLLARIERCLQSSTEFERQRTPEGTLYRRRAASLDGGRIDGGPELRQWWIGDRALEVLDGRPPRLAALRHKSGWRGGTSSVYIPVPGAKPEIEHASQELLRGYDRYRRLVRDA